MAVPATAAATAGSSGAGGQRVTSALAARSRRSARPCARVRAEARDPFIFQLPAIRYRIPPPTRLVSTPHYSLANLLLAPLQCWKKAKEILYLGAIAEC